jgi:glycosyltransferase involved in cell wall biosynthesis
MKPHVLMLRTNPYRPDPAVARAARALAEHGCRVTLVCWDRQAEMPPRETDRELEIIRVHSVRSAYAVGRRQVRPLAAFWREAARLAGALRPDVVHCHDLDTLPVGWTIKRRHRCALVYDAHEAYPALMSLQLPALMVRGLAVLERWLLRRSDATITASTVLRDQWRRLGVDPVVAVGNYADLAPFAALDETTVGRVRAALGVPPEQLLVGYVGGFTADRSLRPMLEAALRLPEIQFHLWGDGPQRSLVESMAAKAGNVRYHGWLPAAEVPAHVCALDVVYYGVRLDYPGAVYLAPNALGLAMAAGRPIIAPGAGDVARVVGETECGVLMTESTPDAVLAAVRRLSSGDERRRLGANGQRAARERYNAAAAVQPLIELYRGLGVGV